MVFGADHDGDEQYQLYKIGVAGGELERLTEADGCQHELAAEPFDRTGRHLLYSVNDRQPDIQDLIIRDLHEGSCRRIVPPEGDPLRPHRSPRTAAGCRPPDTAPTPTPTPTPERS